MVLGEYHKNPSHHQIKAGFAAWFQQRTLIFEMLTETQAKRVAGVSHADMEALGTALAWQGSGWPSFEYFFPIFAAAPEAARFGLAEQLPKHEQIARQASLIVAHFDALLVEMLRGLVGIQRLRNGRLAQSALNCGPVAVITGNEHAGTGWGLAAYVLRADPSVSLYSLGQTEAEAPLEERFDAIVSSSPVERNDPCAAFQ